MRFSPLRKQTHAQSPNKVGKPYNNNFKEEPAISRNLHKIPSSHTSPLRDFSNEKVQRTVITSSTVNFLDDTYTRMKKSADRIAAVLGIERPRLDRDLNLGD